MKKFLLSILFITLCSFGADAKVVLSEDFSLFTAGTEEAPDVANMMMDLTGLTQTPGWSCMYVAQAGGSAYISAGGCLYTPPVDLSGNNGSFVVTFRAKSNMSPAVVIVSDMYMSAMGYVELTSEWKEYSITLNNGAPNYQVVIQTPYSDTFIDDIVIDDMGVGVPVAKPSSNFTKDSFTANWEAASGATSYLLDVYTLEYNYATTTFDAVYILKDKEVTGTSYVVAEGEFDVPYYYTVAAKNGSAVSAESDRITVFPTPAEVEAPVAYEATGITADGFTASWSASSIATKYYLKVAKQHTAVADEEYVLFSSDFSEFTEGSINSPRKELEYLFDGDWSANMAVMASGAIGINNQDINFFGAGLLASPVYSLNPQGKTFKVEFKAISPNGMTEAVLNLVVFDAYGNMKVVDSKTIALTGEWVGHTVALEGGAGDACSLMLTSEKSGMMFIDDFKLSVNLNAAEQVILPVRTYDVKALSCEVGKLSLSQNDKVYYYVQASWAVRQQDGVVRQIPEVLSLESNVVAVDVPTSIVGIDTDKSAAIAVDGLCIMVENSLGLPVTVHSITGTAVSVENEAGCAKCSVAAPGIYIVKAGNKAYKVVVR